MSEEWDTEYKNKIKNKKANEMIKSMDSSNEDLSKKIAELDKRLVEIEENNYR